MNQLWVWWADNPLAFATWADWLDMALLALIVYRLLRVLRGTRAMQSLAGLFSLAVLYGLARVSGMATMTWVLDTLSVYIVIAVLILFQTDIRRALARAGDTLLGPRGLTRADANVMEEVIKAAFVLAHRRIGALIVIEQRASLMAYCEGANSLDALVSTELLQSIFHPSSPLHDGAVVIAKNRVRAAGVFLPISLAKDISRAFGTRHRAAIGLTEATDGIALVISEERGTVAIVRHGEIVPVADTNDLRQRLVEQLDRPPRPAGEVSSV